MRLYTKKTPLSFRIIQSGNNVIIQFNNYFVQIILLFCLYRFFNFLVIIMPVWYAKLVLTISNSYLPVIIICGCLLVLSIIFFVALIEFLFVKKYALFGDDALELFSGLDNRHRNTFKSIYIKIVNQLKIRRYYFTKHVNANGFWILSKDYIVVPYKSNIPFELKVIKQKGMYHLECSGYGKSFVFSSIFILKKSIAWLRIFISEVLKQKLSSKTEENI